MNEPKVPHVGDVLRYPDGEEATVLEVNWMSVKLELASGGFAFVALDDLAPAGITKEN